MESIPKRRRPKFQNFECYRGTGGVIFAAFTDVDARLLATADYLREKTELSRSK